MKIRDFSKRSNEPVPGGLQLSQLLWVLAGVLFLGFAGYLAYEQLSAGTAGIGTFGLVVLLAAAGIMCCVFGYRLWLGQRSARTQLTWLGLIAALPMALRMGRYSLLAAIVLFSVALMWVPASNRYFKTVDPKPRRTSRKLSR